MLKADILNSDLTINNYQVINTLEYIPGSAFTLYIQLVQPHRENLRYMTETGAELTLHLPNKDGTELEVEMEALEGDSSIWSCDLTAEQTADLASGNATFELTEGAKVTLGWIENALALIVTGSC